MALHLIRMFWNWLLCVLFCFETFRECKSVSSFTQNKQRKMAKYSTKLVNYIAGCLHNPNNEQSRIANSTNSANSREWWRKVANGGKS